MTNIFPTNGIALCLGPGGYGGRLRLAIDPKTKYRRAVKAVADITSKKRLAGMVGCVVCEAQSRSVRNNI
jgi:hypothetical protein